MTTAPSKLPTAADYLKYVAAETSALLEAAQQAISCLDHPDDERVDNITGMLEAVRRLTIQAAATFSRDGHDLDTYSDGRQVRTRIDLEHGNTFEYRWHPQHDHRDNRPHTVLDHYQCTSGARRSVVVCCDQLLDVISHSPTVRLVDDHPDDGSARP